MTVIIRYSPGQVSESISLKISKPPGAVDTQRQGPLWPSLISGAREPGTPYLSITICMAWGETFNIFVLQFLHLCNGDQSNSILFMGLAEE